MNKPITSAKDLEHEYPGLVRQIKATAILEERRRVRTEQEASAGGIALMEAAAERSNALRRTRSR